VLHRELQTLGFAGTYQQVQRAIQPLRVDRAWATVATVRFETTPGQQAQVDFGQTRLWIGDRLEVIHIFVFTLGYSRRLWASAYPHERLSALLDGHERAFQHFGGVPLECLYDNPRTLVLGRREGRVLWHPVWCQGSPKCPQFGASKIPHPDYVVVASSIRTSPAFSFSLSR
jgi:transposase